MNQISYKRIFKAICCIIVMVSLLLPPVNSSIAANRSSVDTTSTFVEVSPFIDPITLDPALAYDTSSSHVLRQVYDTLIFFEREHAEEYIPVLGTDWSISPDGLTYTFNIRRGVTFHNGNPLTPSDVAYSLHRGILQGGSGLSWAVSTAWQCSCPVWVF